MPLFRRRRAQRPPLEPGGPPPSDVVSWYLRGQNLEQVGATDEAVALYERAVTAGFDSAGPYDRLLYIYREREADTDVVRVAEAALGSVRTFDQKRDWYDEMRRNAAERLEAGAPEKRGPEF